MCGLYQMHRSIQIIIRILLCTFACSYFFPIMMTEWQYCTNSGRKSIWIFYKQSEQIHVILYIEIIWVNNTKVFCLKTIYSNWQNYFVPALDCNSWTQISTVFNPLQLKNDKKIINFTTTMCNFYNMHFITKTCKETSYTKVCNHPQPHSTSYNHLQPPTTTQKLPQKSHNLLQTVMLLHLDVNTDTEVDFDSGMKYINIDR